METQVLKHLVSKGELKRVEEDLIMKVVTLGQVIRRHRSEGNLQSVPPPTIYGYLAFLRMVHFLPHISLQQVAMSTLLGNACADDRKAIPTFFNEVFGLQADHGDDPTKGGGLF